MAIAELKWPWLGVAIPSFLIAFIGYSSHYFIFAEYFSYKKQLVYEVMISMIWLSYYLAIAVKPGSPPADFQYDDSKLVWHKWCKKCSNNKPERCHHCKSCKTCVLKMDHHCPWTLNCVGYENFPHFFRFLMWVEVTSIFVLYELCLQIVDLYNKRNLPAYLFDISKVCLIIVLTLLDSFMVLTVSILIFRVVSNQFFSGMTQIEIWDLERLESQINSKRLWQQISQNYSNLHKKPLNLSKLVSGNNVLAYTELPDDLPNDEPTYELQDRDPAASSSSVAETNEVPDTDTDTDTDRTEVPKNFTIDDVIFPYDISLSQNIYNCLGPWYLFLWPWSGPPHTKIQNGLSYEVNPEYTELDQLALPWPPDAGSQAVQANITADADSHYYRTSISSTGSGAQTLRRIKVIDPRLKLQRNEWFNDFGEKLSDFGVDVDAEDTEVEANRSAAT